MKKITVLCLMIMMLIGGILLVLVGQEFLANVKEARIQEEFKDPYEMGITAHSVGNPVSEIEPTKFYLVREDLAEKWWGYKFVYFKGVGEDADILARVNFSTSRIIVYPDELEFLENPGGTVVRPGDPDWELWRERFETTVLERYAEKVRRLREWERLVGERQGIKQ